MGFKEPSSTDLVELIPLTPASTGRFKSPLQSRKLDWFGRLLPRGLAGNLRLGAGVSCIVLLTNIIWLAYAVARYGISNGYGTIRQDTCDNVKSLDLWLHLLINVLSTSLQSASNMFLAAFCSPSRKEVDSAHSKQKWLHVGAFGLRNLEHISRKKGWIVACLLTTSIPFHLLYNSLVFTSLFTNSYLWSVASEDFVHGAEFNITGPVLHLVQSDMYWSDMANRTIGDAYYEIDQDKVFPDNVLLPDLISNWTSQISAIQDAASNWERLERSACIQAYSNVVVSDRRHVVLVSGKDAGNGSVFKWGSSVEDGYSLDSNFWICSKEAQLGPGRACNPRTFLEQRVWNVWGNDIDYCLSEAKPAICKVQFSLSIMVVVLIFNIVKLGCMVFALTTFDAEELLATTGDAAISFLQNKDHTTTGICLAGHRNVKEMWKTPEVVRTYEPPRRWKEAISRGRWAWFFIVLWTGLGIVLILFGWGLSWLKQNDFALDMPSLWSLGFGTISQYTMVISPNDTRYGASLVGMAILANLPQVALALIYFTYSTILTIMFIAVDWSRFAIRAQTLMVSRAVNRHQRSMWLLGSPWPYAITLTAVQVLLHWLVSQSLFVAQVFGTQLDGTPYQDPIILNCGYSPVAIMFSMIIAVILLLGVCILMFRKFPAGSPPVVSTNSAAISAACHPNQIQYNDACRNLRWGVWTDTGGGPRHCSMMNADVYENGRGTTATTGATYS